jgi:hypothetical protein
MSVDILNADQAGLMVQERFYTFLRDYQAPEAASTQSDTAPHAQLNSSSKQAAFKVSAYIVASAARRTCAIAAVRRKDRAPHRLHAPPPRAVIDSLHRPPSPPLLLSILSALCCRSTPASSS